MLVAAACLATIGQLALCCSYSWRSGGHESLRLAPAALAAVLLLLSLCIDRSCVSEAAAFRRHDLWLDALAMCASDPDAHLLEPRFAGLLDDDQRRVADMLTPLQQALDAGDLRGSAAERVRRLLTELGHRS